MFRYQGDFLRKFANSYDVRLDSQWAEAPHRFETVAWVRMPVTRSPSLGYAMVSMMIDIRCSQQLLEVFIVYIVVGSHKMT